MYQWRDSIWEVIARTCKQHGWNWVSAANVPRLRRWIFVVGSFLGESKNRVSGAGVRTTG